MSIDEFECSPKHGLRESFHYRMNMWRRPNVNVLGVTFEILDGYMVDLVGTDASLREASDASMSYFLQRSGEGAKDGDGDGDVDGDDSLVVSLASSDKVIDTLRPSELRASLLIVGTEREAEAQSLFKSSSKKPSPHANSLSSTASMLCYSTSRGGAEQLVRDIGRPGLNGCRVSLNELRAMGIYRERDMLSLECSVEGVVKQTTGGEMFAKPVILYRLRVACEREEGGDGRVVREEWFIMRRFNDFVSLHKRLKSQLTENNPKAKLMTALEGSGSGERIRLLPALPPKKSLNAMGVGGGTRFLEQRGRKLGNYLRYLLNRRHVLWSSAEVLDFLCASEGIGAAGDAEDELGRSECSRSVVMMGGVGFGGSRTEEILSEAKDRNIGANLVLQHALASSSKANPSAEAVGLVGATLKEPKKKGRKEKKKEENGKASHSNGSGQANHHHDSDQALEAKAFRFQAAMAASVIDRLKSVGAREVQEGIFDLSRVLLSLDKATFLRGRLIAVIKGLVSFMTSGGSFHKTLVRLHNEYLTGETVAAGIKCIRELLWPDGNWMVPAPPYTLRDKVELAETVQANLDSLIPDTLTSVVGDELAGNAAQLLFEVFQNPLLLRSISYQLLDLILLEVYEDLTIDLDAMNSVDD